MEKEIKEIDIEKIDIDNLLYYYYLLKLQSENFINNKYDNNLEKKIEIFNNLLLNNKYYKEQFFKALYNIINIINISINENNNYIISNINIHANDINLVMENFLQTYDSLINTIEGILELHAQQLENKKRGEDHQKSMFNKYRREKLVANPAAKPDASSHPLNKKSPQAPQAQGAPQAPHAPHAPQAPQLRTKGTDNLVLINAVGDGDCFINAIFDYGLYTNKIDKIYKKLNYIEDYIKHYNLNLHFKNSYYVTNLINNFSEYTKKHAELFRQYNVLNLDTNDIYNIIDKSLYLEKPIPDKYTERINIQKYYTHKHYTVGDSNSRSSLYEFHRKYFIYYMKYIWALYSLTINFEDFKNILINVYFQKNLNDVPNIINDLPNELLIYIKSKYYINNILKENTDFDELTINYILTFYNNTTIFSSHLEISRFQTMFIEPINNSEYIPDEDHIIDTSFQGDKFFIDHEQLTSLTIHDNYKKEYKDGIYEHNISVIYENNDHFLLCLYEDEMSYDFNDKGEIIN